MINVANEGGLELLIKAAQKFKLGNRVGTPLFVWKDQYLMGWSPQNEKLFNEHKVGVCKLYVSKAINVYRQNGVIKLADKVIKKLFR